VSEDAITLLKRSAKGDFDAHRALTKLGIAQAVATVERGDDAYPPYYEATIFARMAAASGSLPDRASLLSLLAICSELARRNGDLDDAMTHDAEGLALAELVADGDDTEAAEYAAQIIANSGDSITPEVVELAKEFKQLWGSE